MKKTRAYCLVVSMALGALFLLYLVLPYRPFVVTSDSMGNRGAVVIVHKGYVPKPDSKHPHAVAFKGPGGEVVTHDLIAIRSDGTITTKGSNNRTDDPGHMPRSAIIGGVATVPVIGASATIPYMGYIALFLRTGMGHLVLIGLAALLAVAVIYTVVRPPKPDPTETDLDREPAIPTTAS